MRQIAKSVFRGARQLAEYLGVSPNTVHLLVHRGALPVRRQGRTLIFVKDEIDKFFASLPGVSVRDALRTTTEPPDPLLRARQRRPRRSAPDRNTNSHAGHEPCEQKEDTSC